MDSTPTADPTPARPILVVEDEAVLREVIVLGLTSAGHHPIAASNGAEALDYLRADREPPGLIILDWMMPVMNGIELLEALVEYDAMRDVPVVVLSAVDLVRTAPEGMVTVVLSKPVRMRTLVEVVDRLTRNPIHRRLWPPVRHSIPLPRPDPDWNAGEPGAVEVVPPTRSLRRPTGA